MNVTTDSSVEEEYKELIATNYVGLASFIVLLYDHALTFDDEIKYIWWGSKKLVIWLFLINRYLTPLGFAINIHAYTSPAWTPLLCEHFVRYEGAMNFLGVAIASLMMAVRVAAIYRDNRLIWCLLGSIYIAMTGVNAWLLSTAGPVHHPPEIHGCSMLFGQTAPIGNWASASAWFPLLYDTLVVVLVVWRTRTIVRVKISGQSRLVSTLLKDGLLYYSVILGANLVLAVMIVRAPDGVKNICAQFQLLITVTMMSRITLNLRKNMANPTYSAFVGSIGYTTLEFAKNSVATLQLQPLPEAHMVPDPRGLSARANEAIVLFFQSLMVDVMAPFR